MYITEERSFFTPKVAGIIQHKNSISSPLLSLFFQPSLPLSQCEGHERMLSGVGLRCRCRGHCPAPAHAPRHLLQGLWGQGRFSAGGKINASCSYSPGTQAGSGAQQEQEPAKQKYWPTFFSPPGGRHASFYGNLCFLFVRPTDSLLGELRREKRLFSFPAKTSGSFSAARCSHLSSSAQCLRLAWLCRTSLGPQEKTVRHYNILIPLKNHWKLVYLLYKRMSA